MARRPIHSWVESLKLLKIDGLEAGMQDDLYPGHPALGNICGLSFDDGYRECNFCLRLRNK